MLQPGDRVEKKGDITRLSAIAARAPALLETMLGYESGRFAEGYAIGLLAVPLRAEHLRFGGLTLRSGGREGLPLHDPEADARRPHVHGRLLEQYGAQTVEAALKKLVDDPRNLMGAERIAKVFPVVRHKGLDPAAEYPMGGGAPQWTLDEPHAFVIAAVVDSRAVARTALGWSVSVAPNAPYENRAKLAGYLARVRV